MNKVNAEMQEHGDMVMLPVSPVAGSLEEGASEPVSSSEVSKGARIEEWLFSSPPRWLSDPDLLMIDVR